MKKIYQTPEIEITEFVGEAMMSMTVSGETGPVEEGDNFVSDEDMNW